jgi:hypothetical protein
MEFCSGNHIILCRMPSHTSHKLQPCDVGVFAPLKSAYRDEAERLCREGGNIIGKEHFTTLYSSSRDKASSKGNITRAWAASGLFPLNRNRVLRHISKPSAQMTMPGLHEVSTRSRGMDQVPQTPTTPISAEAFMSLYSIIQQDTSKETCISRVSDVSKNSPMPARKLLPSVLF